MAQEGLAIWHQCIPGGRRQVAQVGKAVKADHDSDSLSEGRQYCQTSRDTQLNCCSLNNSATN
jgi:hypothetical protein